MTAAAHHHFRAKAGYLFQALYRARQARWPANGVSDRNINGPYESDRGSRGRRISKPYFFAPT